jgi:hypothetical protein
VRVHRDLAEHTKADEHARLATKMFLDMGMTFWSDRAGNA